jgi:hypothetical protein
VEADGRILFSRYCSNIRRDRLKKTTKHPSQDNLYRFMSLSGMSGGRSPRFVQPYLRCNYPNKTVCFFVLYIFLG